MIGFTRRAQRQIGELQGHFKRTLRIEALLALARAIERAAEVIERDPQAGLPAPRPYPSLATPGQTWQKVERYWFRYSLTSPPVITAIFYDSADIPGRL